MMKKSVSLKVEKIKEYFLITHLQVKDRNVTIRDFGKLLSVLMLLLMKHAHGPKT